MYSFSTLAISPHVSRGHRDHVHYNASEPAPPAIAKPTILLDRTMAVPHASHPDYSHYRVVLSEGIAGWM